MSRSASLPPTTRIGCSCICATPRIRIRRKTNSLMRWPIGGHPVARIAVGSPKLLAQEFFRFEIATAVAGAVLGINPFDQPDVEASKVATREMTQAFEKTGALPVEPPLFEASGITLYTDAHNAESLRKLGANATLES
jgi:transaldolase/glucose-6-phosphate isomerase